MPEVVIQKHHLVGTGYAEMPQDGRRFRFKVERYRTDDGEEYGRIVSAEEVPDVGPYLWIPSHGVDASEADDMFAEWQEEDKDTGYLQEHRYNQSRRMAVYNELRDERAERIKGTKLLGGKR